MTSSWYRHPHSFAAYSCSKLSFAIKGASNNVIVCRLPRAKAKNTSNGDLQDGTVLEGTSVPSSPGPLFSNLDESLRHTPGNVLGAATLVAGTAVGAGILALPAVCRPAGFLASSVALTGAACFSIFTGLLVAEVCVNTMCELGSGRGVSLGAMAQRTLGLGGATAVSATYLLLHYTLLVACEFTNLVRFLYWMVLTKEVFFVSNIDIAKAGESLAASIGSPQTVAEAAFALSLGLLCATGSSRVLDRANAVLVGGVLISFFGLVANIGPNLDPKTLLDDPRWEAVPPALPVISLAFVFQNVVPVIASSLEGDIGKIRLAIVSGVLVPLTMFIVWNAVVLGNLDGGEGLNGAGLNDPLEYVRSSGAGAGLLVDAFSLLAVATSFIGFVLGLSEFITEALGRPLVSSNKLLPYALTLLPPLVFAISSPSLFFQALDFAGTYGVLVLFGVIPVAMVWSERYGKTTICAERVAPGGKAALLLTGTAAGFVIINQLLHPG